jgi:hypothetical protein
MKSKLLQNENQRTFVIVFETGDEVINGLLEFAKQNQINSGFFTGLGAFERVTVAFYDLEKKEYQHIPVNEQTEVMSLVGNIVLYEGEPKLHAHVVVGKRDGTAHGGHLISARVRPTLEIWLTASPQIIERKMNEEVGLPLIDLSD